MNEPISRTMRFLKQLKEDKQVVHIAMLRGTIAKPDIRSFLHAHGQVALTKWDSFNRMEKALRYYAEGPDGEIARKALEDLTEPTFKD